VPNTNPGRRWLCILVALAAILALALLLRAPDGRIATATADSGTKNVILMISDGWGYNHVLATDYYTAGRAGAALYEAFPFTCAMSTYSANGAGYDPAQVSASFTYVISNATDSAAAATALSTGFKTRNGCLGVDESGERLVHVMEQAEATGRATGVLTSVPLSHATPAGFIAHVSARGEYAEIAQQMLTQSAAEVIMGAGHPWFNDDGNRVDKPNYDYVGGEALWQDLTDDDGLLGADADGDGRPDPWALVQTCDQFRALMLGDTPGRVVGIVQVATTLQQKRSGADALPGSVARNANIPTLAEMTRAALNVLDEDPDGFVLMIEGGAVDWASHANQSGRMIEEMMDFNAAVEVVCQWVESNSSWDETLLIVTGDHECGYLTGPDPQDRWTPVQNNGVGALPGMKWNSRTHTNSLIPLFAKGAAVHLFQQYADQSDPLCGPYIDNTEVAKVIFTVLGKPGP